MDDCWIFKDLLNFNGGFVQDDDVTIYVRITLKLAQNLYPPATAR